jgi:hypothetical protein
MGDLNLTNEERELAEALGRDRYGKWSRLGFYSAVMLPSILFGAYGILTLDAVAVFIAFLGLFIFLAWRISQEVSRVEAYKGLLRKVLEHEERIRERA